MEKEIYVKELAHAVREAETSQAGGPTKLAE